MKIRKHIPLIYKLAVTFLSVILLFSLAKSESGILDLSLKIVVESIAIFGLIVKMVLGYIFPEIILDENGITIFGRNKISWRDIKKIETYYTNDEEVTLRIERYYKKNITEYFKKLSISNVELEAELQMYLEKYGNKLYA